VPYYAMVSISELGMVALHERSERITEL
jgi:hypothetical protein